MRSPIAARWDRSGRWLEAPGHTHAFVCSIGDRLMRWSNDIYHVSHNLINPPGKNRYSVSFFLNPNPEAMVHLTNAFTNTSGSVSQLNATTYQVTYTTGEIVTINNGGSLINVNVSLPTNHGPVAGLLGSANGLTTNEFNLADGTALGTPNLATLYGAYADAWRVLANGVSPSYATQDNSACRPTDSTPHYIPLRRRYSP